MLKNALKAACLLSLCAGMALTAGPAAAQPATGVDIAGLKPLLIELGYEPTDNDGGYMVERKYRDFTLHVAFNIGGDKSLIDVDAFLVTLDPSKVTAPQLLDLLKQNRDKDPEFFALSPSTNNLYLHRTIDNRGTTAETIRRDFDEFCDSIVDTQKYWQIGQ